MLLALAAVIGMWAPTQGVAQTRYVYSPSDGYLNMRQGPGTQYRIVRPMTNGTRVEVMERSGNWLRIRDQSGTRGWAHRTYLVPQRVGSGNASVAKPVPAGRCSIIIASRQTLGEARQFALQSGFDPQKLEFFPSANGWIAISVGTYSADVGRSTLERWTGQGLIPQDAFCSSGQRFLGKLPPSTVMAAQGAAPQPDPVLPPKAAQPVPPPQDTSTLGGVYLQGNLITNAPTAGTSTAGARKRYQCSVICTDSAIVAGTGVLGDNRRDVSVEVTATSQSSGRRYAILAAEQVCEAAQLYRPTGHGAFCK